MGTWGTGVFSDDIAADVRDYFTDLIAEGPGPAAATKRLVNDYKEELDDPADGMVVWLSLAATQHKLGRLIPSVKNKAVRIIDSGADIDQWSANTKSFIGQRKRHLAKLREQLTGCQPEPKKVRRLAKSSTKFKAGDVFAYELTSRTKVRICVLNIWSDLGGTYATICLLGFDDGKGFVKKRITSNDVLGPTYTMASREPDERIVMLRRGVSVPNRVPMFFRRKNLTISGHMCTWSDYPEVLRKVIRQLGWRRPK